MDVYEVGGAVRDWLLGQPVKDRDWVVVGATPEQMLAAGYKQVGADFPVFLHPETREEYALARTERKSGHGYHGFEVHSAPDVTLEEDLKRRDLTVNAMARDAEGHLVDPFGGEQDLADRVLRHVSPAFAEDPLRILRTARFAARLAPMGFEVAEETMTLMRSMVVEGEVDHLVPERVWQETRRALHEARPRVFFEVLEACGALAVVMPEIASPLEVREGGLSALARAVAISDATEVRFGALSSKLEADTADAFSERLRVPNSCRDIAVSSAALPRWPRPLSADWVEKLIEKADAWRRPERFEQLLMVMEACGLDAQAAARVREARSRAAGVEPRALMKEGYQGKALGEAIAARRRQAIEQVVEGEADDA
ncbi:MULTISPECIES: multifunctional CCA tRNA nucleotidyl transferase/2'3'-cyclic phosphodiesterase/2'nucleotidase/phosphatase [Halomonadaceae]|uniref:CCA-adding enzyme n=1 Tax=Vreelandella halophila TaxID=86177 RepID=A0A9X4YFC9_9GAMM|nr:MULTISPECIES: multifunctional CCA tRNA nucleotidyl transferase/2'3'-cyclic phosphodiesterase/2'nucleotidase/phosphatase [Halomonas]MYL28065.1 multifunctional CCA tRNA nucleotidyl transferase/2'3'-cyclic phosphodiesterase/2'nucleotidase/phosphatase [Halomonas utahensis]MYL75768.1 multifunctional CCA tRNA nucleotidyl transferase/2'3'-cyclic phosphodiesterase/2'nucleotidase/phosphatase [Halomonas sp. 22501_18_FS]